MPYVNVTGRRPQSLWWMHWSSAESATATQSCLACMTFISDGYKEFSEHRRGWSFSAGNTIYCVILSTGCPSVKRWSTNCVRSSTSVFTAWPHRTLWRCANQFLMSLVVAAHVPQPAVIGLSRNQNVNKRTTQFCSVGANKLELTTSIVPWRNPDTRTIPTQTENVAVPFGLREWFHCIAPVTV